MAVEAIIAFCASVLLVQSTQSACIGTAAGPFSYASTGCAYSGLAAPGLAYESFAAPALAYERAGYGYDCAGVASTGGGLPCASASPKSPVGVSVLSENVYEGTLAAGGNLPFLGTVGIEGVLPTAGAGAVSYGCGNSYCAVGEEEGTITTGIAPHAPGPYASGPYAPGPYAPGPYAPGPYAPGPYAPFAGYAPAVAGYKGCSKGCGKAPYKAGCGYGYGAIF